MCPILTSYHNTVDFDARTLVNDKFRMGYGILAIAFFGLLVAFLYRQKVEKLRRQRQDAFELKKVGKLYYWRHTLYEGGFDSLKRLQSGKYGNLANWIRRDMPNVLLMNILISLKIVHDIATFPIMALHRHRQTKSEVIRRAKGTRRNRKERESSSTRMYSWLKYSKTFLKSGVAGWSDLTQSSVPVPPRSGWNRSQVVKFPTFSKTCLRHVFCRPQTTI